MNMSVTDADAVIADLTCGALFYGMRSCEYLDTSGKESKKTKRLEVRDVRFFTKDWALVAHKNLETQGHTVEHMLVKYRTQKNGEKDETIMNRRNGLDLDPVVIWMRIIKRLVKNPKTKPTTYINTVYVRGTDKSFRVTSTMVINMLRNTVTIMGSERLGIPIKSIGTHSIRTSFAMMLNLNKKSDSFIMKQGRWKSSSFLKYIRNYVSAYGGDASSIIARLDNEFVSFLHM